MSETVRQLWPALKEGLLLQEGGDWLLGTMERQGNNVFKRKMDSTSEGKETMPLTTRMSPLVPQCRFLHDRMLQAAYHSLAEKNRQQTHLAIGRLLYKHTEADQQDAQLFTIVEQLNQGRELINIAPERLQLAQLNLQAAKKAKQASVWEAAAQYASIGLALLPDGCWQQQYDLSFGVHSVLAECEYLLGQPEKSDMVYETLLENTHCSVDKAELCATRLVQLIGRGQWQKGIDTGIAGMNYLDMPVSSDLQKIEALLPQEVQVFERSLQIMPISAYVDLPEMTDQHCLMALRILPNLSACGIVFGQTAFIKYFALLGINMSLKAGKSDLMAALLACYAVVAGKEEKYNRASVLAAQVINISESYPNCREYANSLNLLSATTLYLDAPYQKSIDFHYKGYQRGMESGELARAAINFSNILFFKLTRGENLKSVEQFSILSRSKNKALFLPVPIITLKLVQALLRGNSEDLYALEDDEFDVGYLDKIKLSFFNMNLLQYQSQLAFWFDKTQEALLPAALLHSKIEEFPKFCVFVEHILQYGLLLSRQLTSLDIDKLQSEKSTAEKQNTENETHLDFCLSKLQGLSELYAPNFEHKYLLLKAEYGRYQNESVEQLAPLYEAAIESAATNGFLQYEALANELYGAFLLSKSLQKIAVGCLKEALYLYRRWGCTIKVNNLSKRYQSLLMDEQIRPQAKSAAHDAILSSLNQSLTSSSSQTSLSSIGNEASQTKTQEGLDLSSVMKSAQAISGELEIKGLVAKVMLAILENSGAQNGALILNTKNGTAIEASLKTQPTTDINLESRPLEQAKDLPVSLISYVLRTDSDLVLQDADSHLTSSANMAFIEDPYLQKHQPKSVLCIPVDYREKTIGALYLENPLVHNAFPQQRFDIIKMLLTQAAISFENARLFNEVSELNTGLEEKVQRRTQELHQSNEELNDAVKHLEEANKELDSFSHSISHDLRAPLRAISGFSRILLEDYLVALEPEAQVMLQRVIEGANNMGALISGLLDLSRLQKQSLVRCEVPLSLMAEEVVKNLRGQDTERMVNVTIENGMVAYGDQRMLGSALENLLNNAWKYSSKTEHAEISFTTAKKNGQTLFIIKDNGDGFDMKYIDNLFATFQRLHTESEFEGTGVGLATVKRVINKHGGEIWAEAEKGKGATFYFTLGEA
ncbi:MAG: GHKL domain-containing protein [Pseudomonadales bacterium]|nr:GHKL domain-containing protein [Pseudomonadales bacterium]